MEKKKYELSEYAKANKNNYIKEYRRKTYDVFSFKCRKVEEKDIIEFLNSSENKCDVIKKAILEYMANHK